METTPETEAVFLIYAAYKQNISVNGGTYDRPVFHDMAHWAKTARLVMKNNIDPVRFVNSQFMALPAHSRITLTPRMLHMPVGRVLNAYLSVAPDPCDYDGGYAMMCGNLKRLARGACTESSVLSNPNYPFSAWFRVVRSPELTDYLKECYMEAAETEYNGDMRLRQFLKKENLDGRFASSGRSDAQ